MWKRIFQSFHYATRGLKLVFHSEQNFRIQLVAACCVLFAIIIFPLRTWESVAIIMMMTLVLVTELLNTALEYFTDLLKPRLHDYVQSIKDIMAGAVLITSLAALIIGLIIFTPHFINLFR